MDYHNKQPRFLPININIFDKEILFIGGGKAALNKIKQLLDFTSNIRVVANQVTEELKTLPVKWIEKDYTPDIIENALLVYACTNNELLNQRIYEDAHNLGKLVNRADCPTQTDFTSPAIYKKDNMVVAVSSDGQDLKKTINWRNTIKDNFENS